LAAGPAPFGPFEGPKGAQLSQQWETLHDVADGPWEADERTADATNMPTIARAQGTFGRHMAQYRFDTLLEYVDAATVAGQKTLARLRSCACQAPSAWLTALPMAPTLKLKDAESRATMQHRLGRSPLPHNTVGIRCMCAAVPSADDSDHALTCSSVQGKATMCNDVPKGILRRAIHRAGVASTLEPTLRRLPGLEAGAYGASGGIEAAGLEAHGDILLALESVMSVVDVSITHPSGVANRAAAATTDGAAVARRDWEKRRTYGQLELNGYPFIPFSVETYGRLGKPAISVRRQLGLEAKEAGRKVSKSGFVAAGLHEISVGFCWGNYQMYRASLGLLAGVSGRGFSEGAAHPTEEVW
jgi:hypothetical protein